MASSLVAVMPFYTRTVGHLVSRIIERYWGYLGNADRDHFFYCMPKGALWLETEPKIVPFWSKSVTNRHLASLGTFIESTRRIFSPSESIKRRVSAFVSQQTVLFWQQCQLWLTSYQFPVWMGTVQSVCLLFHHQDPNRKSDNACWKIGSRIFFMSFFVTCALMPMVISVHHIRWNVPNDPRWLGARLTAIMPTAPSFYCRRESYWLHV